MKGPRAIALAVLNRLDNSPARLEKILHQELENASGMQPRDRALASNLVYELERNRLFVDHALMPLVKGGLKRLDKPVLNLLRLGALEILLLKTPAHAAVHQAVETAKRDKSTKKAQGLVNGVLRAMVRGQKKARIFDFQEKPAEHISITCSHPLWLVKLMLKQFSPEEVLTWCRANQKRPPVTIRANTLKTKPQDLADKLADEAGPIRPHPLAAECLILEGAKGRGAELPGFDKGLWQGQDAAAALMGHLVGPQAGERVLDMCAGAGGKTGHLAALMENQGEIVAVEPSAGRARALKANLKRLGVSNTRVMEQDAGKLGNDSGLFDRVLIDAPCSGLGVVGRRPDLRWRRREKDLKRNPPLQAELLNKAHELLKPGGVLVYCTCTVNPAENQDVVRGFLAGHDDIRPGGPEGLPPSARELVDSEGFIRTYPAGYEADSFFACRLIRGA